MIVDWVKGAIQQLPTSLSPWSWNWSGVLGEDVVATVSQRYDLVGASTAKFNLIGTDAQKFELLGADTKKFPLIGA